MHQVPRDVAVNTHYLGTCNEVFHMAYIKKKRGDKSGESYHGYLGAMH